MELSRIFSRRAGRLAIYLTVVSLVVLADQDTKAAVRYTMPLGSPARTFIPGVLDLFHVENTGAAFSMGEGRGLLFVIIAVAVLVGSLFWVGREKLPPYLVGSIACVAGGGVGNMVDRLAAGSVTDFLATTFISFPVFNVADICVTLGVAVTFFGYLALDKKREQAARESGAGSRVGHA